MDDIYYTVAHRKQEEIDSFKDRYKNFDTSVIPEIFASRMGMDVKSLQPSGSWGSSHVVYLVTVAQNPKPLIFRANIGSNSEPEYVMLTEKLITDKVLAKGVPTNKILHVDISRNVYQFDYQIQEMLEGKDLEDNFHGTKEEYDSMSFMLGKHLARIHEITLPMFGRFDKESTIQGELKGSKSTFYDYVQVCLESDLHYLTKSRVIPLNTSRVILKIFDEYEPIINIETGSIIHHDLADHNIMFKDNRISGIFDWEAAVIGDPVLDLASCPTWKTHYPRKEKLIEGYSSMRELPEHFDEKMDIYLLRTMLWKMVYAIRADILNDERIAKFRASLKPFNL